MRHKLINEKGPRHIFYDGLMAKELLGKVSPIHRHGQNLGFAVKTEPACELLRQSEGSSTYSVFIRDVYCEIFKDYSVTTIYDWTRLLGALQTQYNSENEEKFKRLAEDWRKSRGPVSSVTQMAMNPSYQQIVGMGKDALPFILRELNREPDHWFWALKAISGIDPVPENSRGDIEEMAKAWIGWGRKEGYVS